MVYGCYSMKNTVILSPYEVVYVTTLVTGFIVLLLITIYYALRSRRIRNTSVYLSGEPESVVSSITPSIASLYWGFIKKFAKSLYKVLVERVHTGSLHDWYKFLSSWFSLLLIIAIIAFILTSLIG